METETPTPKKRRRLLPILLGAIVLCVVLVFVAALISPAEEPAATVADQPPVSAATIAVEPTAARQPAQAQIGDRVEAGGIALTIQSARTLASFDFNTAAEGNTYLVVDALLENVSHDAAPYNPMYFSVKDADSFEYNSVLLAPDPSLKSGELARADRVRGNVAFEVPIDAVGLVLTYEPLVILGGYEPLRVAVDPAN